jgi:CBS domain-containing protein
MVRRTHNCTVTHVYETRDRLETPVGAFISPNDTAGDAGDLLRNPGTTHLLVARRGDCAPEGVVSDLDVLRVLES